MQVQYVPADKLQQQRYVQMQVLQLQQQRMQQIAALEAQRQAGQQMQAQQMHAHMRNQQMIQAQQALMHAQLGTTTHGIDGTISAWEVRMSEHGPYYFNNSTGASQWEPPGGQKA